MSKRSECQTALAQEVEQWSNMPWEKLVGALQDIHVYQVEVGANHYQVEVQLLENTERYVHVSVAIDDGRFPMSLFPLSNSFVKKKDL
jgi:hypothetical protein